MVMFARIPFPDVIPAAWYRTRELFLNSDYVDDMDGVTRTIGSLTKYASNPVVEPPGANAATWDYDKYFPTVLFNGTIYQMWVHTYDDEFNFMGMSYLTSNDGDTWTKPNLGFVEYDGDTDNNLLFNQITVGWILRDPDASSDLRYIMMAEYPAGDPSTIGTFMFKSPTGYTDWTYVQQMVIGTGANNYNEAKAIFKRSDGRYICYFTSGHATQSRHVKAQISDTTDPEGAWTVYGTVIPTTLTTYQHYSIQVWEEHGVIYALTGIYDNATELIYQLDLYISDDGLDFALLQADVLAVGAGGAWDDSMVLPSVPVRIGNEWRVFYSGSAQEHNVVVMNDSRIGYASIGYERFGVVGDNGTLTTDPIFIPEGYVLKINADASGGSMDVELLAAFSGDPIANFTQTDCDTITTDEYDIEPTWGGDPIPPGAAIKLKFYLTDATLHGYWLEEA